MRIQKIWKSWMHQRFLFEESINADTAKLSRRDHEFREPTQRREPSVRSEDLSGELQGEREGFQTDRNKR